MSTKPLLLEGHVDETAEMREEISSLRMELEGLRSQVAHSQQQNMRAIFKLLSPLYKAMQPIFGDLEPVSDGQPASASNAAPWEAVKQRLAPRLREAIDILLLQGSMKRTQLASALKMDYSNCTKNVVGILLRQGWLVDNGGNLSLKQL